MAVMRGDGWNMAGSGTRSWRAFVGSGTVHETSHRSSIEHTALITRGMSCYLMLSLACAFN